MIKGVLLDLDNTLLANPDHVFAAEFLALVENFFIQNLALKGVAAVLLKAMRALRHQRDAQLTNNAFILDFISAETGDDTRSLQNTFAAFYNECYPALKQHTAPIPYARELVEYLKAQDYAIVIATNPIYPAAAVRQRLAWACLPDDFTFYALVTHSENMHFVKPDPAYYAEILARVSIEPDEALMVGDGLKNDITPAAITGIPTFHIASMSNQAHNGSLSDFYARVKNLRWLQNDFPRQPTPDMVRPQLRGNVGALWGILADIKPHFWTQHPDPNQWSPLQIVCHLLESEQQVQLPRLKRILEENNPFLAAPQAPPGPQSAPHVGDGERAARKFADARAQTIAFLETLTPTDWLRPARHSIFGPTNLLEMALFTAQHDRLHLTQLCQTVGNCE